MQAGNGLDFYYGMLGAQVRARRNPGVRSHCFFRGSEPLLLPGVGATASSGDRSHCFFNPGGGATASSITPGDEGTVSSPNPRPQSLTVLVLTLPARPR